ncbi:MmgE/PrpD family protein [Paraburkholderia lycopersici]|uniref:2-methylcitrate dehydratase PrpD n=1 Tax=Paraburkholderia lycopersici TaxID=416944 RepID=A0A1G6ZNA1_9BURK|nr:MmgE/PrpD family protein [Paraburkholderia lycopersici]SDE04001.1 2-methylcitrate dehydratase PrpD [Paraburkholderia lycopersici]
MENQSGVGTAAHKLGRFIVRCALDEIPESVAEKATCCMLDSLGLAALAADDGSVRALSALATTVDARPGTARLWTDGRRVPLQEAVAANACAAHAHFHDDSEYSSWTHPGSLVVPAAVCTGEALNASIATVLRALVAGYGAVSWLGANEEVAMALIRRGVRTSPTLGTIAAAASTAVLLGLGEDQAAHAVSIATSITGGLLEPVRAGSDEWRLQNAHAARGGVLAAQMAGQGMSGAPTALEGPKGLLRAYAELNSEPPSWANEPDMAAILGVVAKPFATLGDNMAAAIAARLLFEDGVDVASVERIDITLWRPYAEYPGTGYKGPFEQVGQALASTAFAVSAMLVFGELEYCVNRDRRSDSRLLELVRCMTVHAQDGCGPEESTVTITMRDGSRRARRAKDAAPNLLRHDRGTAMRLLETRLAILGRPLESAGLLEADVFDRKVFSSPVNIAAVLDKLLPT